MGMEKPSPDNEGSEDNRNGNRPSFPPRSAVIPTTPTEDDVGVLVAYDAHHQGKSAMRGCGFVALLWFAAAAVIFALSKRSPKAEPSTVWEVVIFASYLYLILLGPALGVLYGVSVIGYMNWREKKGKGQMLWRIFMGFWFVVFAAVFLGFGGMCLYLGVQELVRGEEVGASIGVILLGLMLTACGVFLIKLAFTRKSASTEAREKAAAAEYRRAWAELDFAALENELGCTLPAAYKAMLQPDSEWRLKEWILFPKGLGNEEEMHTVLEMEPPRSQALRKHPKTGERMLCFAMGDAEEYWLRLGSEDPPVFCYSDEFAPGELEEIAPRLSVFLRWDKEEV